MDGESSLQSKMVHENGLGDKHPRPPTDRAYTYGGGDGTPHGRAYSVEKRIKVYSARIQMDDEFYFYSRMISTL